MRNSSGSIRAQDRGTVTPVTLLTNQIDLGATELCSSSSWYADIVDFNNDGNIDLLVGMQVEKPVAKKELTDEEKGQLEKYETRQKEMNLQFEKFYEEFEKKIAELSDEEKQKAMEAFYSEGDFAELINEADSLFEKIQELNPTPRASEGVWLFQGK